MTEIIFTYITCVLVLAITLIGLFSSEEKDAKTSKFSILLIATIGYVVISMLTEIFDGNKKATVFLYISNFLNFIIIDFIILAFLNYVSELTKRNKKKINKTAQLVVLITTIASSITTTVFTLLGKIFTIKDGYYADGQLVLISYAFSGLEMVELIFLIILNKRYMSKKQLIVVLLYEIIPIIAIIIEFITDYYCVSIIGLTLSVLIIYILIQNSTLKTSLQRQEVLVEMSKLDLLTGLQNRRCYSERQKTTKKDSNVGIIFCDVNGLKYTNDNFGHIAGDDLIRQFADLLILNFSINDSYRISGDEFVIITENISKEDFFNKFESFKALVFAHKEIAAMGASYGLAKDFDKLIPEAEEKMYQDKEEHHHKR